MITNVWNLVEVPKDRKVVGSKWVFKKKVGANGSVERYKARLVAQGFSQKFGLTTMKPFVPWLVLSLSEQLWHWLFRMA